MSAKQLISRNLAHATQPNTMQPIRAIGRPAVRLGFASVLKSPAKGWMSYTRMSSSSADTTTSVATDSEAASKPVATTAAAAASAAGDAAAATASLAASALQQQSSAAAAAAAGASTTASATPVAGQLAGQASGTAVDSVEASTAQTAAQQLHDTPVAVLSDTPSEQHQEAAEQAAAAANVAAEPSTNAPVNDAVAANASETIQAAVPGMEVLAAQERPVASPVAEAAETVAGPAVGTASAAQAAEVATALTLEQQPSSQQKQPKQKQQKQQKQQQGAKKENKAAEAKLTPRSEDYSRWYLDVVRDAELADYGPVRGTMVIRPYGYALWEGVQQYLDRRFKETGHSNAYFPQLIPYSFLQKEADHVEGFAPELALVTQGGGKELEEPLVVRPTSETIVNHMFAQWVQSYRDLPLLLNQWCNVHRWEMRTRPFIRTLEFLWQEGHTAHATWQEAEQETLQMIGIYEEFARDIAAIPVIAGRKSRLESFAGANCTYTIEAMMGDGKALQAGTSHNLGDNFARAFGTQYLDQDGDLQYVHQSSWGVSTRMLGGVIMVHGDDAGLRLPPRLAPVQVVVVPILKKNSDEGELLRAVDQLADELKAAGIRVKVDAGAEKTPGWKFNHWEMKGVPLRVEVGPRDVASNTCVVARRDQPGKEGKQFGVPLSGPGLVNTVQDLLEDIQCTLLREATAFRDSNIVDVESYEALKEAIAAGKWARGPWAGSDEEEVLIKEETGATLRCIPFQQPTLRQGTLGMSCFYSGKFTHEVAIFAKAY